MIKSDLLNKKYYLDRMSKFLKESYGITNSSNTGQLDILLKIMNNFNSKEKELLDSLNVMNYNDENILSVAQLLGYEDTKSFYESTNCPFLDTVASIVGINRNISYINQNRSSNSENLILCNQDLIMYIKLTVCNSNFDGTIGDLIEKYKQSYIDCGVKILGNMSNEIYFLIDDFKDSKFIEYIRNGNLIPDILGVNLAVKIISQDYIKCLFENSTATITANGIVYNLSSNEIFGVSKGSEYVLTITANDNYYLDSLDGYTGDEEVIVTTSTGINETHYRILTRTISVPSGDDTYNEIIDLRTNIHKWYLFGTGISPHVTNYIGLNTSEFVDFTNNNPIKVAEGTNVYTKHIVDNTQRYLLIMDSTDKVLSTPITMYVGATPNIYTDKCYKTIISNMRTVNSLTVISLEVYDYYTLTFSSRLGGILKLGENITIPKSGATYNFLPTTSGPRIYWDSLDGDDTYMITSENLPRKIQPTKAPVFNLGVHEWYNYRFFTEQINLTSNVNFNVTTVKLSTVTINGIGGINLDSNSYIKFSNLDETVHEEYYISGISNKNENYELYYVGKSDFHLHFLPIIRKYPNILTEIENYYDGISGEYDSIPEEVVTEYYDSRGITLDGFTSNIPMDSDYTTIGQSFGENKTYLMTANYADNLTYTNKDINISVNYVNINAGYMYISEWDSDYTGGMIVSYGTKSYSIYKNDINDTLFVASTNVGSLDLSLTQPQGYQIKDHLTGDPSISLYSGDDGVQVTYIDIEKEEL